MHHHSSLASQPLESGLPDYHRRVFSDIAIIPILFIRNLEARHIRSERYLQYAIVRMFRNTGFRSCLPYVFDKLRGFTNASIAVVVSPGGEW